MRYFMDTEFNQYGTFVELISIGIVAEDGREYYAQNQNADMSKSPEFVREHVVPLLDNTSWKPIQQIRKEVTDFFRDVIWKDEDSVIWTYFGNYDWVAFCGTIFGDMAELPEGVPWKRYDLSQYAFHLGVKASDVPKPKQNHNALADARWNKEVYNYLRIQQKVRLKTLES